MKEKNRLKQLRLEAGLKQEQLADQVGMSQQTISRIENYSTSLNAEYLIILSKFFNVSADYIIGISDHRQNDEQRNRITKIIEEHRLLVEGYEKLDKDHQKVFMKVLNAMVEEL